MLCARMLYVLSLIATLSGTVYAQTSDYVRIVLPTIITEPVPGAFGSQWVTRLTVVNTGATPVRVYPYYFGCMFTVCPPTPPTPAGVTFSPVVTRDSAYNMGAFLYVERQHASDIHVALRVQDLSRQAKTWGTRIPTPSEDDFSRNPTSLLDVPTDSRFRVTLRVYALDVHSPTGVRVSVFGVSDILFPQNSVPDILIAQRTVQLNVPNLVLDPDTGDAAPAFALVTDLIDAQQAGGFPRVRVQLAPEDGSTKIWGFITVTNNETQHVTVIEP